MPVPTIMAVGVANPNAHGQEITSTDIPIESAKLMPLPKSNHTIIVITAIDITTGTNIPLTLSASFAIGAFDAEASSTRCIICDNAVSSPTFSTLNLKYPDLFIVAPITLSPTFFSTAILSPVIADSSIAPLPSTITPSSGTDCPAFTATISPICTSSTPTVTSFPSRITTAVFGDKSISFSIACDVFPFALDSRNFPRVMSASIIAADSKYKFIIYECANSLSPCPSPYPMQYIAMIPYANAAPEPIAISESIFGAP